MDKIENEIINEPYEPLKPAGEESPVVADEIKSEVTAISPKEETKKEEPKPAEETEAEKEAKGVQKRINELTRVRREAERERDALKAELEALKKPVEKTSGDKTSGDKPKMEDFETLDEYNEAMIDFKTAEALEKQKVQQVKQTEKQAEQAEHAAKVARLKEASAKYPDFKETVIDKTGDELPISENMAKIILDIDEETVTPADVLYYLAQNPDESRKIYSMPDAAAARAIGKIEAKLETAAKKESASAAPEAKPAKKETKAPDPIKPLSGVSGDSTDPSKMSDDQWLAYERERLRKQGRLY
jgi:chemotaxis protein histidine kinase CheA